MTPDQVRAAALAFPGATERDHHGFPSFRTARRVFATMPDDEQLRVMLDEEDIRAAVAEWLRTEPSPVQVQFETLLRVFLADQGSRAELLAAIESTRRQTISAVAEVIDVVEDYAADVPPYPERAHLNGLFIAFMASFIRTVLEWCDTAEEEVATWPDTAGVGHTDRTRAMVQDALDYYRSAIAG